MCRFSFWTVCQPAADPGLGVGSFLFARELAGRIVVNAQSDSEILRGSSPLGHWPHLFDVRIQTKICFTLRETWPWPGLLPACQYHLTLSAAPRWLGSVWVGCASQEAELSWYQSECHGTVAIMMVLGKRVPESNVVSSLLKIYNERPGLRNGLKCLSLWLLCFLTGIENDANTITIWLI